MSWLAKAFDIYQIHLGGGWELEVKLNNLILGGKLGTLIVDHIAILKLPDPNTRDYSFPILQFESQRLDIYLHITGKEKGTKEGGGGRETHTQREGGKEIFNTFKFHGLQERISILIFLEEIMPPTSHSQPLPRN